jgi:hypothetical protein
MQDIGTATIPDYLDVPCECNPPATDADAPDDDGLLPADLLAAWEPMGTAYDDFQPRFNDRRYAGC